MAAQHHQPWDQWDHQREQQQAWDQWGQQGEPADNSMDDGSCNALNLVVEFFLLFSHQIQALLFPFSLFFSLSLDIFKSYSEN
jgi:hypothetical protein